MITFENIVFDRILTSLNGLLSDEFSIPVRYDNLVPPQSFLITPQSDSLIEQMSNGQTRGYEILITYQLKSGGNQSLNTLKQVSQISERVKRLINNYSNYSPSNAYKWHDATIQSIEYLRVEDDESLLQSQMTFNCVSMESL